MLVVAASLVAGAPARPCSIAVASGPTPVPAEGETTGPLPLLLTHAGSSPTLYAVGDEGTPIPVVADAALPDGLFGGTGNRVQAFRPAAPLASGAYLWNGLAASGGGTRFFVDAEAEPAPPGERPVTLRLLLDEPDQDEGLGCGGQDSSCDDIDFTRVELELGPAVDGETPLAQVFEVDVRVGSAARESFYVTSFRDGAARETIVLWDERGGLPSFKSRRTCVTLTPIGPDGAVGDVIDLGCVAPDDDDPRVVDTRGCEGGGAARGDLWCACLALVWLLLRARRRGPIGQVN